MVHIIDIYICLFALFHIDVRVNSHRKTVQIRSSLKFYNCLVDLLVYPLLIESRGSLPIVFDLDLILIFYEMQIKIYMPFSAYMYIGSKGSEIASDLLKIFRLRTRSP